MVSNTIARKGVWVQVPHPALAVPHESVGGGSQNHGMTHIRSDETVASAMQAWREGLSDADNAKRHAVAVKTIRRWRRLYVRRGLPRGQRHLLARCPRCEGAPIDEVGYAELLGWYLGDGHITRGRRQVY